MRCYRIVLLAIALSVCLSPAVAQQRCTDGMRTTVTGTIQSRERPMNKYSTWAIGVQRQQSGCEVDTIEGQGSLPSQCIPGRRFTASGKFADGGFGNFLFATSIQCN
jgi:hypothetical protein